jgi:hypothetical protein
MVLRPREERLLGEPLRFGVYFNKEHTEMADRLMELLHYRNRSQLLAALIKQEYDAQFQDTTVDPDRQDAIERGLDPDYKWPWERSD